jgi:acid phosphatase (class A)
MHEALHEHKAEELADVLGMSDEREPRFVEIIDQHEAEGVIKYLTGMLMIDASSTPATYALVRVGRRIGEIVVMCLKDYFHEPRPSQVCPAIVPMLDPPITPSFPAGHALQSYLMVKLVAEARRPLDPKAPDTRVQPEMLENLAQRIAENRTVAGLHYLADNRAGAAAADIIFRMLMNTEEGQKCHQFHQLMDTARGEHRRRAVQNDQIKIPTPGR